MTSRDLAYWIQGWLELSERGCGMTSEQVELLRNHVALVFLHEIDQSMGDATHQEKLNEAHNTKPTQTAPAGERPSPYMPGRIPPDGLKFRC